MQITVNQNFTKRINSTKRPTGGQIIDNVKLKDSCDIKSPVFELNTLDFHTNYVRAFGNYYFADVKNLDSHRSELICNLDHLATFKDQIAAYTGYVVYAAAAPGDFIYKDDPRNGPTTLVTNQTSEASPGWTTSSAGVYLIAMANAISNGNGGAPAYYITNAAGLANIVGAIFDPNFITNIRNQFNGCFDAVVSCSWLPFDGSWLATQADSVALPVYAGNQDLGVGNMAMLKNRTWHNRFYCTIPNVGYNGTYIQSNKYMTTTIYLPGVGVCPLTYDLYKISAVGVTIDVYLDIITGDIVYYLSTASPMGNGQIQSFSGNVAAKVPVVGSSYDGLGVASGILSTAGSAGARNPVGVAQGLLGIARSLSVDNMVVGANSSPLALIHNPNVAIDLHFQCPLHGINSIDELEVFRREQGMPYFDNARLGDLPGYIKCDGASIPIPGDGTEQTVVNGYVNGGFYFE